MFYWIEQNKDWFLSGAGIFVVSSLIGLISSLLTLYLKIRIDKKKRKLLSVKTKLNEYQIKTTSDGEKLKVFYKERTYDNLCQYIVEIKNEGYVGINDQNILVTLPKDSEVVNLSVNCNSHAIEWEEKILGCTEKQEILYCFNRLERHDNILISYLLNTEHIEQIGIQPRGTDGVDYIFQENEPVSDIKLLIIHISLFILAGSLPFIGSAVQAFVLLISSTIIIRVIREFQKNNNKENYINIKKLDMNESARIQILQK